jgi:hypothetical protein
MRLSVTYRTAVYGPVCTVVWQGSVGDRRPYADQNPVMGSCKWHTLGCGTSSLLLNIFRYFSLSLYCYGHHMDITVRLCVMRNYQRIDCDYIKKRQVRRECEMGSYRKDLKNRGLFLLSDRKSLILKIKTEQQSWQNIKIG